MLMRNSVPVYMKSMKMMEAERRWSVAMISLRALPTKHTELADLKYVGDDEFPKHSCCCCSEGCYWRFVAETTACTLSAGTSTRDLTFLDDTRECSRAKGWTRRRSEGKPLRTLLSTRRHSREYQPERRFDGWTLNISCIAQHWKSGGWT